MLTGRDEEGVDLPRHRSGTTARRRLGAVWTTAAATFVLIGLGYLGCAGPPPAPFQPPNLLLVVLDDVGTDLLGSFDAPDGLAACTPSLDRIAAEGIVFRNTWAAPICSPARAQLFTGRHGFRTGVGTYIARDLPHHAAGLSHIERTIAEGLSDVGYTTALFGKWHLAERNTGPSDPLEQGFDHFEGSIPGSLGLDEPCPSCPPGCQSGHQDYYRWVKSSNGVESCETGYATTVNVDDALSMIGGRRLQEPWFVVTSLNAAHSPYHIPPMNLCSGPRRCTCRGPLYSRAEQARAGLEAADLEIGRLIDGIETSTERPFYLFVLSDNGTAVDVASGRPGECRDSLRSKGTLYQGGVRVPLLAWTPGIEPGSVEALTSATDLFATLSELAGANVETEDSISLVPYLDGYRGALRKTAYAEMFVPNGLPFTPSLHERAIRGDRFKLIRRTGESDRLYDLAEDSCEIDNLYPPDAGSPAGRAWATLDGELRRMGVG